MAAPFSLVPGMNNPPVPGMGIGTDALSSAINNSQFASLMPYIQNMQRRSAQAAAMAPKPPAAPTDNSGAPGAAGGAAPGGAAGAAPGGALATLGSEGGLIGKLFGIGGKNGGLINKLLAGPSASAPTDANGSPLQSTGGIGMLAGMFGVPAAYSGPGSLDYTPPT